MVYQNSILLSVYIELEILALSVNTPIVWCLLGFAPPDEQKQFSPLTDFGTYAVVKDGLGGVASIQDMIVLCWVAKASTGADVLWQFRQTKFPGYHSLVPLLG